MADDKTCVYCSDGTSIIVSAKEAEAMIKKDPKKYSDTPATFAKKVKGSKED